MLQEKEFDRIIKHAMDGMQIKLPTDAWDQFSQKTGCKNLSSRTRFDKCGNVGLSHYYSAIGPSVGAQFSENQQEFQILAEEEFDAAIKKKLTGNSINQTPKTSILNSILFRFNLHNHRLFIYKCLEACTLALFFWIFTWHIYYEQNSSQQEMPMAVISEESKTSNHTLNIAAHNQLESTSYSREPIRNHTGNKVTKDLNQKQIPAIQYPTGLYPSLQAFTKETDHIATNQYSSDHPSTAHEDFHGTNWSTPEITPIKKIEPGRIEISKKEITISPILPQHKKESKNKSLWLGLNASWIFDKMWAPGYIANTRAIITNRFQSKGLGAEVEFGIAKAQIATGINYSYKKFDTGTKVHNEGHYINIPLTVKKEFGRSEQIIPYCKIGSEITMAATTSYTPIIPEKPDNKEAFAPLFVPDKQVSDGILKGDFKKNSYFGLHIALGIEVLIKQSSKIFIEAAHQVNPFEKGVGDNNQRLSYTTVNLGFKKNLYEN